MTGHSEFNMLSTLLKMHEQGTYPDRTFIEANVNVLELLWAKGLSCFRITRTIAGNIRYRRVYTGVLTPSGITAAKSLQD